MSAWGGMTLPTAGAGRPRDAGAVPSWAQMALAEWAIRWFLHPSPRARTACDRVPPRGRLDIPDETLAEVDALVA